MSSFSGDSSLISSFRRSPTLNPALNREDRSIGKNLPGCMQGSGDDAFIRSSANVMTIRPGTAPSSAPQSTAGDVEEPLLGDSEEEMSSSLQKRLEFACELHEIVDRSPSPMTGSCVDLT